MRIASLAAAAVLAALVQAAPAAAQLPGLPPVPLPPTDVLSSLPTHGLDPFSISIAFEVPLPSGGASGAPLDTGVAVDAGAVQRSEPEQWCGQERSTDDADHQAQNGEAHYHAMYVVPSDAPDRFSQVASGLQTDAFQASGLIERLYGRAIRFDMGTSCGPQYLDISALRLQQSTADLQSMAATPNATYSTISSDLANAGFQTLPPSQPASTFTGTTNYLVWLDGPSPAGCGQGTFTPDTRRDPGNDSETGGKLALVFREGTGFCNSNAARHEIGHNLGAVQASAPHSDGGGHCNDTEGDTMCLTGQPVSADNFQGLYFDANDDDYWDPAGGALGWWTVNLSRFICPGIACNLPGGVAARTASTSGGAGGLPPGDTVATGSGARPKATISASHRGRRWRFKARVRGAGKARVTVTCRYRRRTRTLLRRTLKLPATVKGSGLCDSKPKVSARAA